MHDCKSLHSASHGTTSTQQAPSVSSSIFGPQDRRIVPFSLLIASLHCPRSIEWNLNPGCIRELCSLRGSYRWIHAPHIPRFHRRFVQRNLGGKSWGLHRVHTRYCHRPRRNPEDSFQGFLRRRTCHLHKRFQWCNLGGKSWGSPPAHTRYYRRPRRSLVHSSRGLHRSRRRHCRRGQVGIRCRCLR